MCYFFSHVGHSGDWSLPGLLLSISFTSCILHLISINGLLSPLPSGSCVSYILLLQAQCLPLHLLMNAFTVLTVYSLYHLCALTLALSSCESIKRTVASFLSPKAYGIQSLGHFEWKFLKILIKDS